MNPGAIALIFPIVLATWPAFSQLPPVAAAAPGPAAAQAQPPAAAAQAQTHAEAVPAAVVETPTAQLQPVAAEPPLPSPPSDRVLVGKSGFFQPSATLQLWLFGAHRDTDWQSTVRVRRAELRVKGEIVPKTFGYFVMIDPARALEFEQTSLEVTGETPPPATPGRVRAAQPVGATAILQDVGVSFLSEYADVSIGQFKNPLSLEGVGSSSKLLFPERSLVSRAFGDRRDLGVKAEKKLGAFAYTLGLFNGAGQNKLDTNDQKDLALRLEVYPFKGLTAALVGYAAAFDREEAGTRDRIEADLKIEKYDALLQAEYILGWDKGAERRVEGHGFYVAAGYTFFDKLQPIARIGGLDPDVDNNTNGATSDPDDEVTHYELGANYYLNSHEAKLQLAGGFFDPQQAESPTHFELTLAAQVSF